MWLTCRECHRTQHQHETALLYKKFAITFFNSYGALFYVAFLKATAAGNTLSPDAYELGTRLGGGNYGQVYEGYRVKGDSVGSTTFDDFKTKVAEAGESSSTRAPTRW